MSDDDDELAGPFENFNKLKFFDLLTLPKGDKKLIKIFDLYKPSPESKRLLSERNRTVFGEVLLFDDNPYIPKRLKNLCIEVAAANFRGQAKIIDDNLNEADQNKFWNLVSVDLPIWYSIDIMSEQYWERVYYAKVANRLKTIQARTNPTKVSWRIRGYTQKYTELIETTPVYTWNVDEMKYLSKLSSSLVYKIRIVHMHSVSEASYEVPSNYREFKMRNFDPDECHHVSLEILGELENLTYLSFTFSPPKLNYAYHNRFFEFSTTDIYNLGSGLLKLKNLTTFKVRNSRFTHQKLDVLVEQLAHNPLQVIHLPYCQLNDDCGYVLSKLMKQNSTITELELAGNYLSAPGLSGLMQAIHDYRGQLDFLGLARNPIHDNGIEMIGRGIYGTTQVNKLDLTGVQINDAGCKAVIEIVQFHKTLLEIDLGGVHVGSELGEDLLASLRDNTSVIRFEIRECGLTKMQELKVRLLIDRNNYIKENPFVGMEMTEETAHFPDEWVKKTKNKIMLNVNKTMEDNVICRQNLKPTRKLKINCPDFIPRSVYRSKETNDILMADPSTKKQRVLFQSSDNMGSEYPLVKSSKEDSSKFTDDEFIQHCELFRPSYDKFFTRQNSILKKGF